MFCIVCFLKVFFLFLSLLSLKWKKQRIRIICSLCYVLATSKVISDWALIHNSVHLWGINGAAPVVDQATNAMTCYPTQSHYPDTMTTSPWPLLIMPRTWLGSNTYQFESHQEMDALLIQPTRLLLRLLFTP